MEKFKEFLKSIGVGKNEAEIYLGLVSGGAISVLEISKRTGLHRSNIYDSLNGLIKKGLVLEMITEGKKLYSARPPTSLVEYLKQKQIEIEEIIVDLPSTHLDEEKSNVFLAKGKFALKESIMNLLKEEKPIAVFGIPPFANEIIGPILKDFHKDRIKRKILMRHIYNSEGEERAKYLNSMKYTEARCLPSKFDSMTSTNIAGDKVVLITWHKDISIIEIKDKDIAQSYLNYFEILWNKSKRAE